MDAKQQGEIAVKMVRYFLRQRGVTLGEHSKREIGNIAKGAGVRIEALEEFMRPLVQELLDEHFASSNKE